MEFASEMIARACRCGARVAEVPTPLLPDGRGRPPHLRPFRDGWRHLRLVVDLWRQARRGGRLVVNAPHFVGKREQETTPPRAAGPIAVPANPEET
jgi:hypothetical protein